MSDRGVCDLIYDLVNLMNVNNTTKEDRFIVLPKELIDALKVECFFHPEEEKRLAEVNPGPEIAGARYRGRFSGIDLYERSEKAEVDCSRPNFVPLTKREQEIEDMQTLAKERRERRDRLRSTFEALYHDLMIAGDRCKEILRCFD